MTELIPSVVQIVATGLTGYFVFILKTSAAKKTNEQKALMLLLRRELKDYHTELMKENCIDVEDYDNFEETYEAYHSLGGNGLATKMFHDIEKLPLKGE